MNHGDDWVEFLYADEGYGQAGNNLRQLVEAGVIGEGKDDPDYVAGRFESVEQFDEIFAKIQAAEDWARLEAGTDVVDGHLSGGGVDWAAGKAGRDLGRARQVGGGKGR